MLRSPSPKSLRHWGSLPVWAASPAANATRSGGKFTRDLLQRYEFLPTRRTIITRAAALCLQHPLRGFDAIHLASGLQLQETLAQQEADGDALASTYVTSDDRLVTAAQTEGLTVENPFWHTDLDTSPLP